MLVDVAVSGSYGSNPIFRTEVSSAHIIGLRLFNFVKSLPCMMKSIGLSKEP